MKYLGMNQTHYVQDFCAENHKNTAEKIKNLIDRNKVFMDQKMQTHIKMSILPNLTYEFNTITIKPIKLYRNQQTGSKTYLEMQST